MRDDDRPADAVGHFDYKGQTYFCAESCLEQFRENPEHFLNPDLRAAAPVDLEAEYTCPMHPEVRRRARRVPDLRHGAGTGRCGARRGAQRRTGGHDATLLRVARPDRADPRVHGRGAAAGRPLDRVVSHGLRNWIEFALATPVVWWGGAPFFERGWASIVNRYLNMFTLIALGVAAAYTYSVVAVLAPGLFPDSFRMGEVAVYFEPAAVIVVLVLLGQVLELRARSGRARRFGSLLGLTPRPRVELNPTALNMTCRSSMCPSAIDCASVRASAFRLTASSSKARPPSTNRW